MMHGRGRRRGCRRDGGSSGGFVAFGLGLLACTVCPTKLVVILLGIALVLCGVSCGKR